jgi:RNA polymerase subunit RPABC4/transcription elongation factor Spt4
MRKVYYCVQCKRLITNEDKCNYCDGDYIKEVFQGCPVNIIGTKQKGKVLKIEDEKIKLIVIDEAKNKLVKEYKVEELKKIL